MSELKAYNVVATADVNPEVVDSLGCTEWAAYDKDEADKYIADLEESHKKEVEQLLMKIAGLEKLVETADKILKSKGGFTIKDIEFGGVKLEGINTHKNEIEKFKEAK